MLRSWFNSRFGGGKVQNLFVVTALPPDVSEPKQQPTVLH
jgi:hypothetical protein